LASVRVDGDIFHENDGEAYQDPFGYEATQPETTFEGEAYAIELAHTYAARLDDLLG
jgi:hypothetical protein